MGKSENENIVSVKSLPKGKNKRLALVISDLSCGGSQHALTRLATYWSTRGHEVAVITLSSKDNDFFSLPPGVQRIGLDLLGSSKGIAAAIGNNVRRARSLRSRFVELQPDAIVAFCDRANVMSLLSSRGLNVPVYVSERSDPRHQALPWAWARLRKLLYPRAHGVVVLTDRIRNWITDFVPAKSVRVIPNAVDMPQPATEGRGPSLPLPFVAALGRLAPEKQFDRLITAFAACGRPDWSLVIFGEGPERAALERLIQRLSIVDRVQLPGQVSNPELVLRHASLFVLSSRREGFPNALAEAMAIGLPVVTVNYPAGPQDIVRDGIDGFIVPQNDLTALTAAMRRLMDDAELRKELGTNAQSISSRFAPDRVMALWDELLNMDVAAKTL